VAGAVATVVMTLEEPLDERLFDSKYDDIAILGKLVTRGDNWWPIGLVLHVQNGALLGVAYARLKPSLPGPPALRGLLAGLVEHVATWPLTIVIDRYHPARNELPKLAANPRAFGQATIRHAIYGIVLGVLEDALNERSAEA
jgi:xanthosine utilization system XapX-like protein